MGGLLHDSPEAELILNASRLDLEEVRGFVDRILAGERGRRKFLESVDVQVRLQGYDHHRDKRFSGTIVLPHVVKPHMKVLVLGDDKFLKGAHNLPHVSTKSVEGLKALKKNKKLVKKDKVNECRRRVKWQMKKEHTMCRAVGNVGMTGDQLMENLLAAVNFLISLLPKGWLQIKSMYIKSTMGPPHLLYRGAPYAQQREECGIVFPSPYAHLATGRSKPRVVAEAEPVVAPQSGSVVAMEGGGGGSGGGGGGGGEGESDNNGGDAVDT